MRQMFRAYYRPTDVELEALWANAVIILDANTLLNLFRYTESTREEFLRVLESLQDSLWIPYQVGEEFHRNRLQVVAATRSTFDHVSKAIDSAKNAIIKAVEGQRHHPSINRNEFATEVENQFQSLEVLVSQRRKAHDSWLNGAGDPDATLDRVTALFDGRVGESFDQERTAAICSEGSARYEKKIPPGYKDSKKSDGHEFGDLIIWNEMLELGKRWGRPVIFVTDDAKDDWWRIEDGKTLGPRTELIDEYFAAAGQPIHFYEPLRFLEYAQKRTSIHVSDTSFAEVEELSHTDSVAAKVLRDRQDQLQSERRMLGRHLERLRAERAESDVRASELQDALASNQQRSVEILSQMIALDSEQVSDDKTDAKSGDNAIDHFHGLRRTAFEHELESLRERRRMLERQLQREVSAKDRLIDLRERRMRSVERELEEVTLALDEIES